MPLLPLLPLLQGQGQGSPIDDNGSENDNHNDEGMLWQMVKNTCGGRKARRFSEIGIGLPHGSSLNRTAAAAAAAAGSAALAYPPLFAELLKDPLFPSSRFD